MRTGRNGTGRDRLEVFFEPASRELPGTTDALYLYGDYVVALTQTVGLPSMSLDFVSHTQTAVTVIDVSDPNDPEVVKTYAFDGWLKTSRRIDGWLRLVLLSSASIAADEGDDWLPRMYVSGDGGSGQAEPIGQYDDFYHPITPDGLQVNSIVSVDLDDLAAEPTSLSVIGDAEVVYASPTSLYLSDNTYAYNGPRRSWCSTACRPVQG